MTIKELQKLSDGTCILCDNGDLCIKLSNGLKFINDNYFDSWELLDDEMVKNYKITKCYIINQADYNLLSELPDNLELLEYIKTQLLLNGDLLLTEFGQDKFRNIIDHWKREMEK